jgi:GTP:adenosylcobinamide-phosphate guanylyltransferase
MRGFILAAGFGTRLKPITDTLPKALVPVCGEPLLAHNLRVLHKSGAFSAIGVNSHYLHEFMERFQRESAIPFELFYERDKIRGTGGALDFARDFLSGDETFLIANVDILHKFDIAELASRFVKEGRICSQVSIPTDSLGTVLYDSVTGDYLGVSDDREELKSTGLPYGEINKLLRRFAPRNDGPCERSEAIQEVTNTQNITDNSILEAEFTGVAFYRREFLDFVKEDDFSIVPIWKRASLAGFAPGIITPNKNASWWMDIGTHEALAKIEAEVNGGRVDLWS